jgi:hypothetical protein
MGRGYINGWGKKVGVYMQGVKLNGVFKQSWVRSTAAEPGSEKLTEVHSSMLRRLVSLQTEELQIQIMGNKNFETGSRKCNRRCRQDL